MLIQIKVACDRCLEDYEFEIRGKNALDTWKKVQGMNLNRVLQREDWHMLKDCLCPKCKEAVGKDNCLACTHHAYKDSRSTCCRKVEEKGDGFYLYDGSLVSEFDVCEHFVAWREP